ncbi:MAG: glycosyltransferase family 2 protein [Candidatus Doudnabacteria bacterium]|nr:glycosyltransferase family 2 protein [Candidatus Doudnabacteria bacterium]
MNNKITVIILTSNEEPHLERCLENILDWAEEIFVVDSFSTDKTLEIARRYDTKIVQHPFENHAKQFNWALDNLPIQFDWVLRLDADEYLTEELKKEITEVLPKVTADVSGFLIKRRVYFMGRWIRHGGYYPIWLLRLFRYRKGKVEDRNMDEHTILLAGRAERLQTDFIDENRKGLTWWIAKHNQYAGREAEDILNFNAAEISSAGLTGQAKRTRWLKEKIYLKLPLFWRACFYFCYRYVLRLGFLDGKAGLIFHFLQAFWYRFLVDAKIYESRYNSSYGPKKHN